MTPPRPLTGFAYLDAVGTASPGTPGDRVLAMAHRGGAGHPDLTGLENTVRAFRHAVDLGYRYLETDVQATSDGVLVAFHDPDLLRMTGRADRIAELTAAQLAEVELGEDDAVPTMSALLEEFPDCRFNIDLKSAEAVDAMVALVRRTGAADRICVGSFSRARIERFRRATQGRVATAASPIEAALFRLSPSATLVRLATPGRPAVLQLPHRRGRMHVVTPELVRLAHRAGVHVHVWTVDEPEEIDEVLEHGVDGIFTDRTDVLKDVLTSRGLWEGADG